MHEYTQKRTDELMKSFFSFPYNRKALWKINDSKVDNHDAIPKAKLKYFYFIFISFHVVSKEQKRQKTKKYFKIQIGTFSLK